MKGSLRPRNLGFLPRLRKRIFAGWAAFFVVVVVFVVVAKKSFLLLSVMISMLDEKSLDAS